MRTTQRGLPTLVARSGHEPLVVFSSSHPSCGRRRSLRDAASARRKTSCSSSRRDGRSHGRDLAPAQRLRQVGRPNYNSAVATFCHNIAPGLPMHIDDPAAPLPLLYVDDLIDQWLRLIADPPRTSGFAEPRAGCTKRPSASVADIAPTFADVRLQTATSHEVGDRASSARSIATFIVGAADRRGSLSACTPHRSARHVRRDAEDRARAASSPISPRIPGSLAAAITITARSRSSCRCRRHGRDFAFATSMTGETYEIVSDASQPTLVETIPGWTHDITNVGDKELIVLLVGERDLRS